MKCIFIFTVDSHRWYVAIKVVSYVDDTKTCITAALSGPPQLPIYHTTSFHSSILYFASFRWLFG
jgi:hypothetical protein